MSDKIYNFAHRLLWYGILNEIVALGRFWHDILSQKWSVPRHISELFLFDPNVSDRSNIAKNYTGNKSLICK